MMESISDKMQGIAIALAVGKILLEKMYHVSYEDIIENQEELSQQMTADIEFNGINGDIYG